MAQIHASRFEFEAAVEFGQNALAEYSRWHNLSDEFFSGLVDEVEAMKNHSWSPPE